MSSYVVQGNALALPLADGCVQTVCTSPPYWGLRDYGTPGQLGLEPIPDCLGWATGQPCGECYVCHMVQVFREVRRVMRPDATCWCNLGDSYMTDAPGGNTLDPKWANGRKRGGARPNRRRIVGLKHKDLCGIPWRVALALQADGWYLRSDIIWAKSNPMPESVTDRTTKAHEYLFLLSKSPRYYYDAEAIREPSVTDDTRRPYGSQGAWDMDGRPEEQRHGGEQRRPNGGGFSRKYAEQQPAHGAMTLERPPDTGYRNKRSVWHIATESFSGAHFATFPRKLVEPCILAGSSERGCCPACGAGWVRQTEPTPEYAALLEHNKNTGNHVTDAIGELVIGNRGQSKTKNGGITAERITTGWRQSCACPEVPPVPCLVMDPFCGSGTVGRVAVQHRRRFVGVELNPAYIQLARERTARVAVELFSHA